MTTNQRAGEVRCRHCGGVIWNMGDYSGWVHAATWTRVCDTSTHEPVAEPAVADQRAGWGVPESREVRDEKFWRSGANFHWCWPHFDRINPADKHTRAGLNRYPHNVIGAYVVIFGRGFGIRWKDSR